MQIVGRLPGNTDITKVMLLGKVVLFMIAYKFASCRPCYNDSCACCLGEVCNPNNGKCIYGCKNGYWGDRCYNSCPQNCVSCHDSTRCYVCVDGFYNGYDYERSIQYSDCSLNCSSGAFLWEGNCYVCGTTCITCNWFNTCAKCKDGYYIHSGKCFTCGFQCKSCTSSYKCNACKEGYYEQSGGCHQCRPGCNSSNDNCNGCNEGYFLQHNSCIKCMPYCISCSSQSYCTKCQSGYYLSYSHQHISCVQCPINCTSCNSLFYCSECKVGFKGNVCSEKCSNCKTGTACDRRTGECLDGCTVGYSGALCDRKCSSVCKSCLQHNADKCFQCVGNRYGKTLDFYTCEKICPDMCLKQTCHDDTGNCIIGCEDGYWGRTCSMPCSDNCVEDLCRSENGICSIGCKKGYKGERCNCPQNCNCNEDGICGSCSNGFAVTIKNCICTPCLDSTCTSCVHSRYYVMDNFCCPCNQNCNNNECTSDSECLGGCKIGYYKTNCSKLCTGNDLHCLECLTNAIDGYGGCKRCISNYYPSQENNICRVCPETCKNGTCDSRNGICTAGCKDGLWGHECEKACDPGCVICAQKDGMCSVCANDRYLHNCSLTCSETCNTTDGIPRCRITDGACTYGCVNRTVYGKQCEKKCSSTCKEQICNRDTGICLNGCKNNYFGPQCKHKCQDTCLPSPRGKLCYESNGTCLSNCHNGYHGYMCDMACSQNCVNRTCERLTGACEYGCEYGYEGLQCESMASQHMSELNDSELRIGVSVGATVLVLIFIGVVVAFMIIKRRRNKRHYGGEDVVTYSEVESSVNQAEQNDAVYAVPNKPKKKAAERLQTTDKINNDTEDTNAPYQEPKTKHGTDYGDNMPSDKNASCNNDNIVNRASYNKPALAPKPKVLHESTDVPESVFTNSGAQYSAKTSTDSYLEIEEEDLNALASPMGSLLQESTRTGETEFDYAYYNVAEVKKRKVMLNKLSEYVSKKTKEDYIDEFNNLPTGLIKPYTESQKKENLKKNRYKGIYPYDQRRVILQGGDSNYINASYVDGYKKIKAYIASIGPTYKYMDDMSPFWRMVWQEKVGKIVMLTKLSKAGEPKCDQYWPEKGRSLLFTDIRVTTDSEEIYADYTVRSFIVQKNSEVRSIIQAHFTAWPDKGTPDDVTSLIMFRQKVDSSCTELDGPMVVHCSAGIGRTGTYIAVDSLTQEGEAEGGVDIYACVRNLREQRVNMVQTAGQYQYLHNAVVHTLTFDSKPIKVSKFHEYMSTLTTAHFTDQFKHLLVSIAVRSEDETEAVRLNVKLKDKNRPDADIPGENNRPRLHLRRSQGMSGYINALYVNSFRTKNRFLVAQTPLPNTVEDFLTLIVQEKVSCVVSMETNVHDNKTVGAYYPVDSQPLKVGCCTVRSESAEYKDKYEQRKLKIIYEGKSRSGEITVTHIRFTRWSEKKKIPDDPKMFMKFVEDVDLKYDSNGNDRPILIHCLTGAEKSGLFCVVSVLLEKTQLEQEISVVNTVRQVKNRRHKAIPNKEQYIFCHQCLDEYLHTFDTYSNFCLEK